MISSRDPSSSHPTHRFSRLLAALVATAVSVASVVPAAAQTTAPDEAVGRRHFEKGQELYSKNRFLEAAKEFEAGYQALPRSAFLLNVGHSYRRAHELRKAKAAYELMLKVDPTTQHRPLVEDLIRNIDDALTAQQDTTPPPPRPAPAAGPTVATVPGAPGSLPLPTPPSSQPIDLGPPSIMITPTEQPAASESRSLLRNPWFWGVVGAVLVTGTVGTVLLVNRSGRTCPAQECFPLP